MSDDAYSAALNLVKDHTLLEADSVLRALVAEIERLRKIKAAAQRYIAASSDDSAPPQKARHLKLVKRAA